MAQFKAFASGVEVKGAAVVAVVKGMGAYEASARRLLADANIVDLQEERWYPQQAWLSVFRTIAEKLGPATLRLIGTKITETALWPPTVNSVEAALASIDIAYQMNHRGGDIGHYRFDKTGKKSGVVVCQNPYPCDFDLGIIEATVKRFSPDGVHPQVIHDAAKPCRKKGDASCTYQVLW
jgi:hypothetical protein